MLKALSSSETSVSSYETTRGNVLQDSHPHILMASDILQKEKVNVLMRSSARGKARRQFNSSSALRSDGTLTDHMSPLRGCFFLCKIKTTPAKLDLSIPPPQNHTASWNFLKLISFLVSLFLSVYSYLWSFLRSGKNIAAR
jgi:hypothetical protein